MDIFYIRARNMDISGLLCLVVFLSGFTFSDARRYPRRLEFSQRALEANRAKYCPDQCRCMTLGLLSLRGPDQNWQYPNDESWKRIESIPVNGSGDGIQGRDVVCTGLNQVPWSLPEGTYEASSLTSSQIKKICFFFFQTDLLSLGD